MFGHKNALNGRDLVIVTQDSPQLQKLFLSADATAFPSRLELRNAFYAAAYDLAKGIANPPSGQPKSTRTFYESDYRSTGNAVLDACSEQYRNTLRVDVGNSEVVPGGGGFELLSKDPVAQHLPERTKKTFFPSARSTAHEPVGAA